MQAKVRLPACGGTATRCSGGSSKRRGGVRRSARRAALVRFLTRAVVAMSLTRPHTTASPLRQAAQLREELRAAQAAPGVAAPPAAAHAQPLHHLALGLQAAGQPPAASSSSRLASPERESACAGDSRPGARWQQLPPQELHAACTAQLCFQCLHTFNQGRILSLSIDHTCCSAGTVSAGPEAPASRRRPSQSGAATGRPGSATHDSVRPSATRCLQLEAQLAEWKVSLLVHTATGASSINYSVGYLDAAHNSKASRVEGESTGAHSRFDASQQMLRRTNTEGGCHFLSMHRESQRTRSKQACISSVTPSRPSMLTWRQSYSGARSPTCGVKTTCAHSWQRR